MSEELKKAKTKQGSLHSSNGIIIISSSLVVFLQAFFCFFFLLLSVVLFYLMRKVADYTSKEFKKRKTKQGAMEYNNHFMIFGRFFAGKTKNKS